MADTKPPAQPADVYLRSPDGRVWVSKPEDVPKGLAAGLRQETPEEAKDRELRTWARDNPGLAAGAAALRTVTFGASALVKSKEQAALAQQNPVATTATEISSLLLPIAGEWGAASKAARIASESQAVRNAAKVADGILAASGAPMRAASAVGRAAGSVAGKGALGTAAHYATEAELYNIGANLSEAALGDENLTAERLLAHSGSALALGAGLGVGGKLIESAASKAAAASSAALERARAAWQDHFPQADGFVKNVEDAYTALAAKATGKAPERIRPFVADAGTPEGMARRAKITKTLDEDEVEAFASAMANDTETAINQNKTARRDKIYGDAVPNRVKADLAELPFAHVQQPVLDTLAQMRQLHNTMRANPQTYGASIVDQFNTRLERAERAFGKAVEVPVGQYQRAELRTQPGKFANAAEAFDGLWQLRKNLSEDISKMFKAGASPEQIAARAVLQDARDVLQNTLRNPQVFGEQVGLFALADKANRLSEEAFGKGSLFNKEYMKKVGDKYVLDFPKFKTTLRQVGTTGGTNRDRALNEFFTKLKEANDVTAELTQRAGIEHDRELIDSLLTRAGKAKAEATERLGQNNRIRQMTNDVNPIDRVAKSGLRHAATIATGGMLGGIPGMAAAGAYALVTDPVLAGKVLLGFEKLNAKVQGETREKIAGYLRTATGAARTAGKAATAAGRGTVAVTKRVAVPASIGAMHAFNESFPPELRPAPYGSDKSDSRRVKAYRQTEALLREIAANPERAYDRYAEALKPFAKVAPQLTTTMIIKQLQAAAFLAEKLPKNPSAGKTLNDAINDWRPSDQELARFERYLKAAQDPLSVLDDLKQGTMTREGTETLQALYPALYQDIQQVTLAHAAQLERRLPYAQRINLSILLGVPVDSSMDQQFISTMQGFYTGSVQDAKQGKIGGLSKGTSLRPSAIKQFDSRTLTSIGRTTFGGPR